MPRRAKTASVRESAVPSYQALCDELYKMGGDKTPSISTIVFISIL